MRDDIAVAKVTEVTEENAQERTYLRWKVRCGDP